MLSHSYNTGKGKEDEIQGVYKGQITGPTGMGLGKEGRFLFQQGLTTFGLGCSCVWEFLGKKE